MRVRSEPRGHTLGNAALDRLRDSSDAAVKKARQSIGSVSASSAQALSGAQGLVQGVKAAVSKLAGSRAASSPRISTPPSRGPNVSSRDDAELRQAMEDYRRSLEVGVQKKDLDVLASLLPPGHDTQENRDKLRLRVRNITDFQTEFTIREIQVRNDKAIVSYTRRDCWTRNATTKISDAPRLANKVFQRSDQGWRPIS